MAVSDAEIERRIDQLVGDFPPATTDEVAFLGAQFDAGLAWAHFPEGMGGLGASPTQQMRVLQRLSAAHAPSAVMRNVIGYGMVAPTLVIHGTPEQQERYLRPLFTGEEVWCQLFSEPGAGSDVAGLATRAERDGDEWVLNGQKVWTTLAHVSAFGLIIARTDPDAVKHKGITAFLVDMTRPRGGRAAPLPGDRRGRVQRVLLQRRPRARLDAPGRGRRGLGRVDHDADERAGVHRRHGAPAKLRA